MNNDAISHVSEQLAIDKKLVKKVMGSYFKSMKKFTSETIDLKLERSVLFPIPYIGRLKFNNKFYMFDKLSIKVRFEFNMIYIKGWLSLKGWYIYKVDFEHVYFGNDYKEEKIKMLLVDIKYVHEIYMLFYLHIYTKYNKKLPIKLPDNIYDLYVRHTSLSFGHKRKVQVCDGHRYILSRGDIKLYFETHFDASAYLYKTYGGHLQSIRANLRRKNRMNGFDVSRIPK